MTVGNSSSGDSDIESQFVQIQHETAEKCIEYMSQTENMVRSETSFVETIRVAPLNQITRVLYEPRIVRGLPWKLFVLQNFSKTGFKRNLCLGVICDVKTDAAWACSADITVTLINQIDVENSTSKSVKYMFSYKNHECLFTDFIHMKEFNRQNSPYVESNCFLIKVDLQVNPPKGFMWDSRKISGYVGLVNQGATCYLNSLLQTLYFASPLKKIIFKAPTEIDNKTRSVVLSLQYTFMDLLYSERAVNTKKLTDSFGWSGNEVYVQRDVQEMCRLLIDHIETKIKATVVEGEIAKLMEGKSIVAIKCLNVNYMSQSTQTFYDVQLSVKNMQNLYRSFDEYCADELLEGDNKYSAQQHGLQDAVKNTRFQKFPPILHLHLLRFVVNMETFNYEKVNDRFEFPKILNLSKYLAEDSTDTDEMYHLQSVLVHCGNSNGGHYMAYVCPNCDRNWFKFDDDIVSSVNETEAIDGNFGCNESRYSSTPTAYMLMYVKSTILMDPTYRFSEAQDIPDYLKDMYDLENDNMIKQLTFENNTESYTDIRVMFDDILFLASPTQTIDLRTFGNTLCNVPTEFTIKDVVWFLANQMGVEEDSLRIWIMKADCNIPLRPCFVSNEVQKHNIKKLIQRLQCPFFVQRIDPSSVPFTKNQHLMLFLHYFDPTTQNLTYHGFHQIDVKRPIGEAVEELCKNIKINFSSQSFIFHEKWQYLLELVVDKTETAETLFGDINDVESIVIQTIFDETADINDCNRYPMVYAHHYLQDIVNTFNISFHLISAKHDNPDFVLNLSKKMTFHQMLHQVSKYCDVPSSHIRIYKCKSTTNINSHIKSTFQGNLNNLFNALNRYSDKQRLYYIGLRVAAADFDDQVMYSLFFKTKEAEGLLPVFVDPDAVDYQKIMTNFRSTSCCYHINVVEPIRMVCLDNFTVRVVNQDEDVCSLLDEICKKIKIEEIPLDQQRLDPNDVLITVNIKVKQTQSISTHQAFLIKINSHYTYQDVIEAIKRGGIKTMINASFVDVIDKTSVKFPSNLQQIVSLSTLNIDLIKDQTTGCFVAESTIIIVEVSDPSAQQPRSFRYDQSIRIHD